MIELRDKGSNELLGTIEDDELRFLVDELEAGYHALGDELWEQAGGRIDAFVQAVGTAHSIHGAAHALRNHSRRVHVVAMEPGESAVLSGKPSGSHNIEGIDFIPPLWRPAEVNEIIQGADGRCESDGAAARPRGGPLRGDIDGRQHRRRAAGGSAARLGRDRGHDHHRFGIALP